MAEHWRDDDHGRRLSGSERDTRPGDGARGYGYGYGAREGGGSERGHRDRDDAGFDTRAGREDRTGADVRPGREERGGVPGYGERVGYLDRGVSGDDGERRRDGGPRSADFRSAQGGFHEREAGQAYGTDDWDTDDTPTWRQLNRNHEPDRARAASGRDDRAPRRPDGGRGFAGYGGAQIYDGGPDLGRGEDRLGGLGASRTGYAGRREDGTGGAWGAFGQDLSGPGRREDDGPHRGRGPRGWTRSDERIREDAHERLTDDPMLDAGDVTVEVSGGEVTLAGFVDDRAAKRRAEDLMDRIGGVTHVQNNLRVRSRQGEGAPGAGAAQRLGAGRALGSGDGAGTGAAAGADRPGSGAFGGRDPADGTSGTESDPSGLPGAIGERRPD